MPSKLKDRSKEFFFQKFLESGPAFFETLIFFNRSCEKMTVPSTSQQFSALNDTFETDCAALERSIRKLKHQAAQQSTSAQPIRSFDEGRLASRAKDLRSMTEQVEPNLYSKTWNPSQIITIKIDKLI